MSIKRIRTIAECLELVKKDDPHTALSYHTIKKLCEQGKVKHFKTGNKIMVNLDDLLEKIAQ